ncbi:uncharacterized protein LOC135390200 [Ornithodoros turicata]
MDGSTLEETQSETKLYEEPKYIVFESCLTELFKTCRECFQPCRCSFTTSGTLVTVLAECHQGHTFQWTSQPHIGKKAAGNALLSAALLYSGSSPTCTLRMLRQMRVQVLTDRQYYRYQGAYLFPTVNKVYKQQQEGLLEDLGTDPTSLASDGRCDSPGHSAKFLTYSFYSDRLNKIIHFEQVQVKESTEVQASSHMEKEGLVRGLKFMEDNHVHVASLTTDRHPATKKYMRTAKPGIKHYFDVWHVSKGIKKKLSASSNTVATRDLKQWIPATVNHIYWCAAVSGGDGDLLAAMWKSSVNHVANIHEGHDPSYPRCLHKPNQESAWLQPGSVAHAKFKAIVTAPLLLKDIPQLSPATQTYGLESFHSVLNNFAPKSTAFSPEGMLERTSLAILHFNENSCRKQAQTLTAEERWKLKVPKGRGGHIIACPVKEDATFSYVDILLDETLLRCSSLPSFKAALEEATPLATPPMTSDTYPRQRREDIIEARKSRFVQHPQ